MSLRSLLVLALAAALLAGCGSADDWSQPHAQADGRRRAGRRLRRHQRPARSRRRRSRRALAPGRGVHPTKGYRVVLLTTGEDAPTRTLEDAVTHWATDEDVSLKTVVAGRPA